MYHRFTTQSDQIKPNEGTQLVRLFKLRSVCECGWCEIPQKHNTKKSNEPNKWAASLGKGAEREGERCGSTHQTPAGGGRKQPEKTGHVGHRAAQAASACWATRTEDMLDLVPPDGSIRDLQHDSDPKHSGSSTRTWTESQTWRVRPWPGPDKNVNRWWVKHLTAEKVKLGRGQSSLKLVSGTGRS